MATFNYNISITGDCTNSKSGAISLTLTGGTPPYTVEWITPYVGVFTDVVDTVTIQDLYSNVYFLRVNDSTLPENEEFYINIPISNGLCVGIVDVIDTTCGLNNGSVTVSSTTLYSAVEYNLYDTTNNLIYSAITNTETFSFLNLASGIYYVTGRDLGGCTGRTSDFIIENSTPLDFGLYVVPDTSCASCGSVPIGKIFVTGLTGTPPYEINWSNGMTGATITGLTSGSYTATVTDSYGCSKAKIGIVEDAPQIGLGLFTVEQPTCFMNNGSITLTITGGTAPYYYSASTGYVEISYSQSITLDNLSSGDYFFLITDSGLCTLNVGTNLVSENGMQSVVINSNNSTCSSDDGSISIITEGGVGPYTYSLVYPDSSTVQLTTLSTSYIFTNLNSGTYLASVEDSSGCIYSDEIQIITSDSFLISTNVTNTTCGLNNGSVRIITTQDAIPPLNYSIGGFQSLVNTSLYDVLFTNIPAGAYTASVTDSLGCTQTQEVFVSESSPLIFSLFGVPCTNGDNGEISVIITSGEPPFIYNWSSNVFNDLDNPPETHITGLSGGTYTLNIIDSNGCSLTKSIELPCVTSFNSGLSGESLQTYLMGGGDFDLIPLSRAGMLQMLNEGYIDLTGINPDCILNSAEFIAKVSVAPLGLSGTQSFYSTTSLSVVPSDNLWFDAIKSLILSIPGISNVSVDELNNQLIIQTIPGDTSLTGQEVIIELVIVYDISC